MNPFVAFLIFVPLIVSFFLWAVATWALVNQGPKWDIIVTNLIFAVISGALIYMLMRTSKGPVLDDKEIQHINIATRRTLTRQVLAVTYVVLFLLLSMVMNLRSLRNWLGFVSTIMAIAMVVSAVWEFRHTKTERLETSERGRDHYEASHSGYSRIRNRLVASTILTACSTTLLFWNFNGQRLISTFDFIGLLLLAGSAVIWLIAKMKRGDGQPLGGKPGDRNPGTQY